MLARLLFLFRPNQLSFINNQLSIPALSKAEGIDNQLQRSYLPEGSFTANIPCILLNLTFPI